MAQPTPGPSKIYKETGSYVPKSRPENVRILCRIAAKIKEEHKKTAGRRPKAIDYTGLQPDLISKLTQENTEYVEIKVREVERSVIYHQLMDLYIYDKIMPTTFHLFVKLYGKIPAHMDLGEFRNYLYKNGFMWKQILRGTCVVIENPKVTFERQLYLKALQEYRKQGKTIYFIDEVAFDINGEILTMKQSLSNSEAQIRVIYAVTNQGVKVKQFVIEFSTESFLRFIKDSLLKYLPEPSVIVLNNYKHHCQELLPLPNEDSLKKEMCDWLEFFDVPHDPEMPKALLFELIQKYSDISKKLYLVDNILKQNGHEVLRLPDCIMKLTPTTYYFDMLRVNLPLVLKDHIGPHPVSTCINKIMSTIDENVSLYCTVIEAEEKAIQLKDSLADDLLDELEDVTKNASAENNGQDSELPSSDSDSD
ncbi:hypothetical protein PYW07_011139 [Mythimna separata]|uniref:Uncharacterized protein n=1 Tax=Mythimna separata TaxID=271217 RepID=A0AAD8DK73_MYTSE|nr:hypothetical protein PYW07_011139 [Mythimna separata]